MIITAPVKYKWINNDRQFWLCQLHNRNADTHNIPYPCSQLKKKSYVFTKHGGKLYQILTYYTDFFVQF